MPAASPPTKRIKLELDSDDEAEIFKSVLPPKGLGVAKDIGGPLHDEDEDSGEHCSICLQPISDRTVIPPCSHEFCFECLLIWTEQSRKCPLCTGAVGEYVIHNIRSKHDFQKHYLTSLRTSPKPDANLVRAQARRRREIQWGRNERRERERERRAADELERAIEKRRWVYRHRLYAKHVASNSYTRYKPFPTPAQFAANQDLISRATIFIRRELQVWDSLDVEFLTTFTVSVMKSLDIRSEPAIKLLAEFLDMDSDTPRANAEHFAHELYCYLRSPFRDLSVYDSVVQYDTPPETSPPRRWNRERRWASPSPSPKRSNSVEAGPSRRTSSPPRRQSSYDIEEYRPARSERHRSPSPARRPHRDRHCSSRSEKHDTPRDQRSGEAARKRSRSRSMSSPSRRRPSRDPEIRDVKGKGRAVELGNPPEAPVRSTMRASSEESVEIVKTGLPIAATNWNAEPNKELSIRGAARRQNSSAQAESRPTLEQRLEPPTQDSAIEPKVKANGNAPSNGTKRAALLERLRAEKALARPTETGTTNNSKGDGAAAQKRDAEMLEAKLRARLAGIGMRQRAGSAGGDDVLQRREEELRARMRGR